MARERYLIIEQADNIYIHFYLSVVFWLQVVLVCHFLASSRTFLTLTVLWSYLLYVPKPMVVLN